MAVILKSTGYELCGWDCWAECRAGRQIILSRDSGLAVAELGEIILPTFLQFHVTTDGIGVAPLGNFHPGNLFRVPDI
jgi:hypothetical protein